MITILYLLIMLMSAMEPKLSQKIKCPQCESVVINIESAHDIEIGTPETLQKSKEKKKAALIIGITAIISSGITAAVTISHNISGCR